MLGTIYEKPSSPPSFFLNCANDDGRIGRYVGGRKECIYELESVVGMSSQIVIIFVGLRVVRSPTVSQSYVLRLDFTKFDTVHFLY